MSIRNQREYNKKVWQRMTKKERVNFFVITTVILLLFALVIAGGIVMGITNKPWLFIIGFASFIGFGLSFPVIGRVKRILAFRAIKQNGKTAQAIAQITGVWVGWQSYKGNKIKSLTLNIYCSVNGFERCGWYKFSKEELANMQTEKVLDSTQMGNSHLYRNEVSLDTIDNLFKIGDEINIRYRVDKPKYCVILKNLTQESRAQIADEPCDKPNKENSFESNEANAIEMPAVFQTEPGEGLLTELYSKKTRKEIQDFLAETQTQDLPAELLAELEKEARLCFAIVFKKR